jgi:hypothetical protein
MKKGMKPTNFDPAWWKTNKTKGLKEDSKLQVNMDFLYRHYTHYPTLNINSKDNAVMTSRVNYIRQTTIGIKATKKSVDATLKNCLPLVHDDDKIALKQYLVLLKKAEDDRQNWIKLERGVGNTENLEDLIIGPGLDDRITI